MVISKVLKIGAEIPINILTKSWGVKASIYAPLNFNNENTYFDNNIEYEKEPFYEGKILAPFIFKSRQNTPVMLDDIGEDLFVYVSADLVLPRFSLIEIKVEDRIDKVRVEEEIIIRDDERIIYHKYKVIPVIDTYEFTNDFEKIEEIEDLEFELEPEEKILPDNEVLPDDTTEDKIDKSSKVKIGKIK